MTLTIVMYHYVRDVARTRFPRIHARSLTEFESQLDHVAREYEPVRMDDVVAAYRGGLSLPERACLLTFDDGLADHRDAVLPALAARGLSGVFAPPAATTLERRVADVQKSQFVLAAEPDHRALLARVGADLDGQPLDERYDDAETARLKELLQLGAPEPKRRRLLDALFAELVTDDEAAFAEELYLTLEDVRVLRSAGMEIAGHGVSHRQLAGVPEAEQRREIAGTVEFLRLVHGSDPDSWTMCYPSGSYDSTTLRLVADAGCAAGLTVRVGTADSETSPLELPRLDTNDLPF